MLRNILLTFTDLSKGLASKNTNQQNNNEKLPEGKNDTDVTQRSDSFYSCETKDDADDEPREQQQQRKRKQGHTVFRLKKSSWISDSISEEFDVTSEQRQRRKARDDSLLHTTSCRDGIVF